MSKQGISYPHDSCIFSKKYRQTDSASIILRMSTKKYYLFTVK